MQIEIMKTSELVPYAKNAKLHSDSQVAAIAGSIREFGFNNPVLIDKDNGIIAGHGRVLAAQVLKLADVPCIRLAHLTETQKRAYILKDNRLAEIGGGWDLETLRLELEDIGELTEFSGFKFDKEFLEEEELLQIEDETVEMIFPVSKKWHDAAIKKTRAAIKIAIKNNEQPEDSDLISLVLFCAMLLRHQRAKRKRYVLAVPLTEPLWLKYSIDPERLVTDFQVFLNEKY